MALVQIRKLAAPAGEKPAEGMSYGRGAALLSALIGVTGLMTYAFHSIVAHTLGRDAYGMIAVLWAAVFLTASVIYRPVEQLLSRTIAEQRRARAARPARRCASRRRSSSGWRLLFAPSRWPCRTTIEDELFSG